MNFYASRDYLDAAAAVYFKGRHTAVEDVRVGEDVLRLLVVDDRHIISRLPFLDFHQPLDASEVRGPVRKARYVQNVVRGIVKHSDWKPANFPQFELAPYIDWSEFRNFDAYRDHLLARHRGQIRDRERRWRSLAAANGELVFTMNDCGGDVLACARQWKSRQLRETGERDYFSSPKTMEFLETLRARNVLVSSTLRAAGRLVSLWIGFVHQGSWSGWIFTYDPAFRKYSAGHQLLNCMLEESYRLGHREFDFSDGGHDYKMMYATHGRLLGAIGRPPFGRRLVIFAKDALQRTSPQLFQTVRLLKKRIAASLVRPAVPVKARGSLHRAAAG
ncbi:MAG: GNAT family N-acetyltransferase [Alphaproteobacteria bacterium]|nr:GNAT family N-acetyltransferase [Alphaproteobacteria bacterium]